MCRAPSAASGTDSAIEAAYSPGVCCRRRGRPARTPSLPIFEYAFTAWSLPHSPWFQSR